MYRMSRPSLSPLVLLLVLLVLVHLHLTTAQSPICNGVSCTPDHSIGCAACNSSSTKCQAAWYGQPGVSCGTAVAKPKSGRPIYTVQCCPDRYQDSPYHCQSVDYTAMVNGVTYDVAGFSCVRERAGMDAAQIAAATAGAVCICVGLLLAVFCGRRLCLRRRAIAASAVVPQEGNYTEPLMQSQPVQPFSSQAYHLDMQPQHAQS